MIFNVDEGVSCAEIDTNVFGYKAENITKHVNKWGKGLKKNDWESDWGESPTFLQKVAKVTPTCQNSSLYDTKRGRF